MPLTPKELVKYKKLEKKMKTPYDALSDKDLDSFEEKNIEYYSSPSARLADLKALMDYHSQVTFLIYELAEMNIRLIQDVRYWMSLAKAKNLKGE